MSRQYLQKRGLHNLQKRTYYDENNPWDIPCVFPAIRELNGKEDAISFNYALTYKGNKEETICHFFVDDYQFERVWTNPDRYVSMLRKFKAVAAPDFSISDDFPTAIKIYNVYRKAWLTRYFQEQGVCMLPTAEWGGEDTFEYAFAGIPKRSPVCVTAAGISKNKLECEMFETGLQELKKQIDPIKLNVFGTLSKLPDTIPKIMGDTEISIYVNANIKRLRERDVQNKLLLSEGM